MGTRYASHTVRNRIEIKLDQMNECQANPVAWDKIQNKTRFQDQKVALQRQRDAISPPDTTGSEKDNIRRRINLLTQALRKGDKEVPPMPAERQMWESSAGDVGQHIRWEKFWKTHTLDPNGTPVSVDPHKGQRGAVWELKDLLRTYKKDSEAEDPDVANIELIRPYDARTPLAGVQRRSYGFSGPARDNYDRVFGETESDKKPRRKSLIRRREKLPVINPCKAYNKNGKACAKESLKGSNFCFRVGHRRQVEQMEATTPEFIPDAATSAAT